MIKVVRLFLCFCFMLCLAQAVFAATYTVTKIADTSDGTCDADCSLREAIVAANGTVDNDVIVFSATVFNTPQIITLSGTDLIITNNGTLTINGTGANLLTISGNNVSRVFTNNTGAVTNINNIRVTGGTGVSTVTTGRGGGVYNSGGTLTLMNVVITGNTAANGGGTNNAGTATLTLINCEVSNNSATGAGGGMQNFSGNTLNLINTTVSRNTSNSTLTGGGAIQANGTINMSNVTMSGNTAQGGDGGAMYYNGQGLTINNSTIANNTATSDTGGLFKSIATNNANIRNTIIANNTGGASPDAANVFNSLGNNLIGNVGTSTGWIASDLQNQNPLLAPLGNYGGIGMTHALLTNSPAINAGQNCVVDLSCGASNPPNPLTTDQRGATRPTNTTVDIGAFEVSGVYVATLPNAKLTQAYNVVIAPDNGTFTFALTSGNLPMGVNLTTAFTDAKGDYSPDAIVSLSGTPMQTGTFNFAITVSNGVNSSVTNYRLNVTTTAGSVSVGGRVFFSAGNGLPAAFVTITDQSGNSRSVRTSSFGYYRFDDVVVGQTYTVSVSSKQFQFTSQMVTVNDVITNLDFTAQP